MVNTIKEKAMRGLPLDGIDIIDCHCHMGYYHVFNAPHNTKEGLLESMDSLGIDYACVTAHASIGPDYRHGNDMVKEAVTVHPDRFFGYVTVNPNFPEDMQNELDRCFDVPGFIGIKTHPACHGQPIDYKNYRAAFETADKKGCPFLIHTWGAANVVTVSKLADDYTNIIFIIGHGGADTPGFEKAIEVVASRKNLYIDVAISNVREGNVEWLVKEMGSKKILFGSDMPFFDPRPAFGRVAFADISENEKKDIFGLNMKAILKI